MLSLRVVVWKAGIAGHAKCCMGGQSLSEACITAKLSGSYSSPSFFRTSAKNLHRTASSSSSGISSKSRSSPRAIFHELKTFNHVDVLFWVFLFWFASLIFSKSSPSMLETCRLFLPFLVEQLHQKAGKETPEFGKSLAILESVYQCFFFALLQRIRAGS